MMKYMEKLIIPLAAAYSEVYQQAFVVREFYGLRDFYRYSTFQKFLYAMYLEDYERLVKPQFWPIPRGVSTMCLGSL